MNASTLAEEILSRLASEVGLEEAQEFVDDLVSELRSSFSERKQEGSVPEKKCVWCDGVIDAKDGYTDRVGDLFHQVCWRESEDSVGFDSDFGG